MVPLVALLPLYAANAFVVSDYLSSLHHATKDYDSIPLDKPSCLDSGNIITPMTWGGNRISKNMYRVCLPPTLLDELRTYANHMGITDFYRGLVIDNKSYKPGEEELVTFNGQRWMVHRPKSHWR